MCLCGAMGNAATSLERCSIQLKLISTHKNNHPTSTCGHSLVQVPLQCRYQILNTFLADGQALTQSSPSKVFYRYTRPSKMDE